MLKGNRDVSWYGLNGIIVQEIERTREGLVVLLNDVWHVAMIEFQYISSRILWVKFKFSRIKVCGVVGYGPTEGIVEKGRGSGMACAEL